MAAVAAFKNFSEFRKRHSPLPHFHQCADNIADHLLQEAIANDGNPYESPSPLWGEGLDEGESKLVLSLPLTPTLSPRGEGAIKDGNRYAIYMPHRCLNRAIRCAKGLEIVFANQHLSSLSHLFQIKQNWDLPDIFGQKRGTGAGIQDKIFVNFSFCRFLRMKGIGNNFGIDDGDVGGEKRIEAVKKFVEEKSPLAPL